MLEGGPPAGAAARSVVVLDLERGIVINDAPPSDVFGVWTLVAASSSPRRAKTGAERFTDRLTASLVAAWVHGRCQSSAAVSAQLYKTQEPARPAGVAGWHRIPGPHDGLHGCTASPESGGPNPLLS